MQDHFFCKYYYDNIFNYILQERLLKETKLDVTFSDATESIWALKSHVSHHQYQEHKTGHTLWNQLRVFPLLTFRFKFRS